jgi:hypothetical protein
VTVLDWLAEMLGGRRRWLVLLLAGATAGVIVSLVERLG